jgi:hypothetical protein
MSYIQQVGAWRFDWIGCGHLHAEEELERRVDRFFDELVIHLIRGYEGAWRRAAHAAA